MISPLRLTGYVLMLTLSTTIYAQASIIGSCADITLPKASDDAEKFDTTLIVRVLRDKVQVKDQQSRRGFKPIPYLKFDTRVEPLRESGTRIQVRELGSEEPLGWVEKQDLLCQVDKPLWGEKGLPRKALVKLSTDTDTHGAPVYASPDPQDCAKCEPHSSITRFNNYFIFAEDPNTGRHLLAQRFNLTGAEFFPLVGWVDKNRLISWNTAVTLRPKNDTWNEQEANIINGYQTLGRSESSGVKLNEGNIWYTYPMKMPLLGLESNHYHVAAPGVGMKGFNNREVNLDPLKRVDVFFVLDATKSMEPYIEQTREVVKDIANRLQQEQDFRETTFRFGFVVYRDDYADAELSSCQQGICERMPLSSTSCQASRGLSQGSSQQFRQLLSKVNTTGGEHDDYPERLFGGLEQAVKDFATCPDNTKVIVVVGDSGDREPTLADAVIRRFKRFPYLVLLFVQTPNNRENTNSPIDYQEAYDGFTRQAKDILNRIYAEKIALEYHLYLNEASDMVTKIVDKVKGFSNSTVVSELEQALANGEAVKDAINKYRRQEGDNFPVLYWQFLEAAACKANPEQCEKPVFHQVDEFYIPIKPNEMQEEILMPNFLVDKWLKVIKPLTTLDNTANTQELRSRFKTTLIQEIQGVIREPPIETDDSRELKEILIEGKNGLPFLPQSPLLQYTFKDFDKLATCELKRLINELWSVERILTGMQGNPTLKIKFTLKDYDIPCPGLSEKGRKIRHLDLEDQASKTGRTDENQPDRDVRAKLGPNDNYSYCHGLRGIVLCSIPVEVLP